MIDAHLTFLPRSNSVSSQLVDSMLVRPRQEKESSRVRGRMSGRDQRKSRMQLLQLRANHGHDVQSAPCIATLADQPLTSARITSYLAFPFTYSPTAAQLLSAWTWALTRERTATTPIFHELCRAIHPCCTQRPWCDDANPRGFLPFFPQHVEVL